jgi:hypothetical protein
VQQQLQDFTPGPGPATSPVFASSNGAMPAGAGAAVMPAGGAAAAAGVAPGGAAVQAGQQPGQAQQAPPPPPAPLRAKPLWDEDVLDIPDPLDPRKMTQFVYIKPSPEEM